MGGDNLAVKLVVPDMEVGLCYKFLNLFQYSITHISHKKKKDILRTCCLCGEYILECKQITVFFKRDFTKNSNESILLGTLALLLFNKIWCSTVSSLCIICPLGNFSYDYLILLCMYILSPW